MKKITELTEVRWRYIRTVDEYGNREKETEEYLDWKPVRTIEAGPRFIHYLIDYIIFRIFFEALFFLIRCINPEFNWDAGIFSWLLSPLYYFIFEYKLQKTPGKYFTKSIVIDEYGNKPDLRAIVIRSLSRLVPIEPYSCWVGNRSYGWHDSWSKTWVVTEEELAIIKKLQLEQSIEG